MSIKADARLLTALADLLDYPRPDYLDIVRKCEKLVVETPRHDVSTITADLTQFGASIEAMSSGQLEETYTATFDLGASLHLYVGAHLFGESYKRSVFLLWLKERFRTNGFDSGTELPDHLPMMLRFLARCDDSSLANELIADALQPVLKRMVEADGKPDGDTNIDKKVSAIKGVYDPLLRALLLILEEATNRSTLLLGDG